MSILAYQSCPLCGLLDDARIEPEDHNSRLTVRCPTCADFTIVESVARRLDQARRYKLSAWTRDKKESGQAAPLISTETLDAIISSFPNYSVAGKQRLLIQVLAESASHPGKSVYLDYRSLWPRVWASGPEELHYLSEALEGRGLVEFTQRSGDRKIDYCRLTPAGWDYIDNIQMERSQNNQAFVAMWFHSSMDSAWDDGIKPALVNTGYVPYRVDNDSSNLGRIDAKIESEIKHSRFLVADVTGGRQGVYYEAGYAMGLGLPVIWSVRDDRKEDMHFDTRQYNHIIWCTPGDLKDQLRARVISAIGEG